MRRRHPLLLYRMSMARYPGKFLALAALLLGLWSLQRLGWAHPLSPFSEIWLAAAGGLSLAGWAFTRLAPRLAYVEPRPDHLCLRVPLYRLNVSYRRILSSRPIEFSRLFPPGSQPRRRRRTLKAYQGHTALAVDLSGWPLPPWLRPCRHGSCAFSSGRSPWRPTGGAWFCWSRIGWAWATRSRIAWKPSGPPTHRPARACAAPPPRSSTRTSPRPAGFDGQDRRPF